MQPVVSKQSIRLEKRLLRKNLQEESVSIFSAQISRSFVTQFDLSKFSHIHMYSPIKGEHEVDTSFIIDYIDRHKYLIKISFPSKTPVIDKDVDIVIVPVIAFDRNLNRIGFGGGYYDKILSSLDKQTIKVGLAYEFSKVRAIPAEEHDVKLDYIITEMGIYTSK